MSKPTIKALKNGPFLVTRVTKLVNSKGDALNCLDEMYLCRCGGSSDKPYCDGTHKTNGFSGLNDDAYLKNETKAYKGAKITIYDNRNICSHRGYCTTELPTVFKDSRPWIDPDGDTVEKIIALCNKCPSGALTYALNGSERNMGPDVDPPSIRLAERHFGYHGPYDVSGEMDIVGQLDREPESPIKASLCRCGHSKNKPYCSGEHYYIKFEDKKNG